MVKQLPILMYHSIQSVPRSEVMRSLHVAPATFRRQMYLLNLMGFRGLGLTEALKEKGGNLYAKVCAITFDDGYRNFITNALPALDEQHFKATIYVPSSLVGSSNIWDLDKGISANSLMDWDELQALQSRGFEIGCHGASHIDLAETGVDLSQEISAAKNRIEEKMGKRVNSLCYPYGSFNNFVIKQSLNDGFDSAVTMRRGRADLSRDDYLSLPRIPITWHTTAAHFMLKILTGYEDRRSHQGT